MFKTDENNLPVMMVSYVTKFLVFHEILICFVNLKMRDNIESLFVVLKVVFVLPVVALLLQTVLNSLYDTIFWQQFHFKTDDITIIDLMK